MTDPRQAPDLEHEAPFHAAYRQSTCIRRVDGARLCNNPFCGARWHRREKCYNDTLRHDDPQLLRNVCETYPDAVPRLREAMREEHRTATGRFPDRNDDPHGNAAICAESLARMDGFASDIPGCTSLRDGTLQKS